MPCTVPTLAEASQLVAPWPVPAPQHEVYYWQPSSITTARTFGPGSGSSASGDGIELQRQAQVEASWQGWVVQVGDSWVYTMATDAVQMFHDLTAQITALLQLPRTSMDAPSVQWYVWTCNTYHHMRVRRDAAWWEAAVPRLSEAWQDVLRRRVLRSEPAITARPLVLLPTPWLPAHFSLHGADTLQENMEAVTPASLSSSGLHLIGARPSSSSESAPSMMASAGLRHVGLDIHEWARGGWLAQTIAPPLRVVFLDTDLLQHAPVDAQTARALAVSSGVVLRATEGLERRVGTALVNDTEMAVLVTIVRALLALGLTSDRIGVVTPYRSQHKILRRALQSFCTVEVLTVDKIQGRDMDVIIMSFVRSNPGCHVGDLLREWRRINVAITRAKVRRRMCAGSMGQIRGGGGGSFTTSSVLNLSLLACVVED